MDVCGDVGSEGGCIPRVNDVNHLNDVCIWCWWGSDA